MRRKINVADSLFEVTAAALVMGLFIFGQISFALAMLGLFISLSLVWPFKAKRHTS